MPLDRSTWWSCRKKGTKGLWLRSFRDPNVFGNLKGLPELFNFEGLTEEVLECSFDIADEKQCRLIVRKTSC
ncbi:unnamed protein product [Lasius platythorax]|uniref:Uncharacterized protein n=1 Tax=Lasius platythorax TaxID=488582 RepID=A0AAV2N0L1_9HYME